VWGEGGGGCALINSKTFAFPKVAHPSEFVTKISISWLSGPGNHHVWSLPDHSYVFVVVVLENLNKRN
jgi:hypothetical protein